MRYFLIFLLLTQLSSAEVIFLAKSSHLKPLKQKVLLLAPPLLKKVKITKLEGGYFEAYSDDLQAYKLYKKIFSQAIIMQYPYTKRAKKVIDFANPPAQGIEAENNNTHYIIKAFGEYQPVVQNSLEGAKQNRRAEVALFYAKDFNTTKTPSLKRCLHNKYVGVLDNITLQNRYGTLNVSALSSQAIVQNSIHAFSQKILANQEKYEDILNAQLPFYGLYLSASHLRYISKDYLYLQGVEYASDVMLRWEIFKDGYMASKKNIEQKTNERQIEYLQMLFDMSASALDEQLFHLEGYRSELNHRYYKKLAQMYEKLLKKRNQQLINGFTTLADVEHLQERLDNARRFEVMYANVHTQKIPQKIYMLLNKIECFHLIDEKELTAMAIQKSLEIKIRDRFEKRADFFPSYSDNIKLNLYVEHKSVHRIGNYQAVGIHADIPLDFKKNRAELIRLNKSNYTLQKEAIKLRIKQKVSSLYTQYAFALATLKNEQNSLLYRHKREAELEHIEENIILDFKQDPEREHELLKIEVLSLKNKIIMQRFELYRILLQLYALSGADSMQEIIQREKNDY